jgi:hypothetical protein
MSFAPLMTQVPSDAPPPYLDFATKFRRNANSLATFYGAKIWLVGSALFEEDPRDYDVRVFLDRTEFKRLFGSSSLQERTVDDFTSFAAWEWKLGYENLKRSRILSWRMNYRVDFQIQSEAEARAFYGQKTRVRLDTSPDWVLTAGRDVVRDI